MLEWCWLRIRWFAHSYGVFFREGKACEIRREDNLISLFGILFSCPKLAFLGNHDTPYFTISSAAPKQRYWGTLTTCLFPTHPFHTIYNLDIVSCGREDIVWYKIQGDYLQGGLDDLNYGQ